MSKPAEDARNSQMATSTPHTDDESITTSTESDSLETWTLVNDKKRKNKADIISVTSNSSIANNRIENVTTNLVDSQGDETKDTHESNDSRTDDDSNVDDISEGISIISESESAGRASPLAISDNFNNVNIKSFSTLDDISPTSMLRLPIHIPQSTYSIPTPTVGSSEENALRQRRIKRSSSSETPKKIVLNKKDESIVESSMVYPLVRRGLKGLFFVCTTLSILAFIGKLRNPDWQPFSNVNNLSVLEQKLTDLELQNNLMRAEIDILSKQVNYLSSLSESGRIYKEKAEREQKPQQRNFKQTGEWIMKQEGKSEDNLKRVVLEERTEPIKKNMNDYLKTIDDIAVDQVGEDVQSFKDESNTGSATKEDTMINENEYENNKHFSKNDNRNSKEREYYRTSKNIYEKQKIWKQKHIHQQQDSHDENDDDDDENDFSEEDDNEDIDDSLEGFGKPKFSSKEQYNKHGQIRSNTDKYKQHHQRDKINERSKERRFKFNSKESRHDDSDEHSRKSGEWHEKLMQQRENARRHNDFREPNRNWFIKRGDSREKIRLR